MTAAGRKEIEVREDAEWHRALERINKRTLKQARAEKMPETEEQCRLEIEAERARCAWHTKGFNPPRLVRLTSHAYKMGWKALTQKGC